MDFIENFYSKEFNAQNLTSFKRFLKEKGVDFNNKELENWYNKQDLPQRIKQFRKRTVFNPIITLEPNTVLYIDSMFLLDDKLGVILAIDLFSKKAYGFVKKVSISKGEKIVFSSVGIKSKDTAAFLKEILNTDTYKEIRTDNGSEFQKDFQKVIRERGLEHTILQDVPKRLNSPVERFNRTFRNLYEKKKMIFDGKIFRDYKRFVAEIIETYNNSFHRTIGNKPIEVYNNVGGKQEELIKEYRRTLFSAVGNKEVPLPVGTKVRLYIPQKKAFNKLKPHWSKIIYTIGENTYIKHLRRYLINDKLYDRDYIQVVGEEIQNYTVPRQGVNVIPREEEEKEDEPIAQRRQRRNRRDRQVLDL